MHFYSGPPMHFLSGVDKRMKNCNQQAAGMTGDTRKNFMSSCLSGEASHPKCAPGKSKPCGNTCIAIDKTCHK
jgi:hypothetical protein